MNPSCVSPVSYRGHFILPSESHCRASIVDGFTYLEVPLALWHRAKENANQHTWLGGGRGGSDMVLVFVLSAFCFDLQKLS